MTAVKVAPAAAAGSESDSDNPGVQSVSEAPGSSNANYTLRLDTVSSNPGTNVDFSIYLQNVDDVSAFNLLIKYDPSALWAHFVSRSGTRAEDFEYFVYTLDEDGVPGNMRLVGIADLASGDPTPLLPAGDGAIAEITFSIINDIDFAGMYVPVRFVFLDYPINDDNTLTDGADSRIDQSEIAYRDGYVAIQEMGDVNIGDINLNSVPAEVGDYVYLSNHFINPISYPLNALQLANADLNRDYVSATIADLVTMINLIISGAKPIAGAALSDGYMASITGDVDGDDAVFRYETDFPVGGLLLTVSCPSPVDTRRVELLAEGMEYKMMAHGNELRVFVYSLDGSVMPAGEEEFLTIGGLRNYEISAVDLASAGGQTAAVTIEPSSANMPEDFVLYPNYPNPFNPSTTIGFYLENESAVQVTVYDILGRSVLSLYDGYLDAGRHELIWEGRNGDDEAVASGVYFYRLVTDAGAQTRKMMLMK